MFTRGLMGMMLREGIYCGGYLGIMPVVRQEITTRYPDSASSGPFTPDALTIPHQETFTPEIMTVSGTMSQPLTPHHPRLTPRPSHLTPRPSPSPLTLTLTPHCR